MKIRTDFVTNSSSSSFVAVNIHTDNGSYTARLESGNVPIKPGEKGGRFDITELELKSIINMKEILQRMSQWLYDTIEDPYCWNDVDPSWCNDSDFEGSPKLNWDDCKQVMKYYGWSDNDDLEQIPMELVKSISIFSRMEYYDEPFGATLMHYDYTTQSFIKQERGADDETDSCDDEEEDVTYEEDPYGEELEDAFNHECSRYK